MFNFTDKDNRFDEIFNGKSKKPGYVSNNIIKTLRDFCEYVYYQGYLNGRNDILDQAKSILSVNKNENNTTN